MFGFIFGNWLVWLALALSAAGFLFSGFFGAVAGVPLFLLDWSLKLGAILRLDLAEIARGFDVDGFDYTREGMMRIAKEALK